MNMRVIQHLPNRLFQVEQLTSADIVSELIKEISDFFRYIFCNAYQQYLFDPKYGLALPPSVRFLGREGYIPLAELDNPPPPQPGEETIFWHDPLMTLRRMHEKFKHQAHLVLLRKHNDQQLAGLTFGYETRLEDAFNEEEWHNPHHYSQLEESPFLREYAIFEAAINKAIADNRLQFESVLSGKKNVDCDTMTYVWNCVALSPELQGKGVGTVMMKMFAELVQKSVKEERLQLAEVLPESAMDAMLKKGGAIDVPGAFGAKNPIGLIMASLQDSLRNYLLFKK